MKNLTLIALIFTGLFSLAACNEDKEELLILPDLEGYTISDIEDLFSGTDIVLSFHEDGVANIINDGIFIEYTNEQNIGDTITEGLIIYVVMYPDYAHLSSEYFEPLAMVYYGPMLNIDLLDVEAITPHVDNPTTSEDDDTLFDATGGAFLVSLKYCADGDTAIFYYPDNIYEALLDPSKRARFLNMDTEETYTNNEEEWGKPASVYTCALLTSATSIIIQTDPGDELLGNYDRLLSWIWVKLPGEDNYHLLNYMVVKQGLAQVKFEWGSGETIGDELYTYNQWMHIAEDYAIVNRMGQWGSLLDYYWDYNNDGPDWDRWHY